MPNIFVVIKWRWSIQNQITTNVQNSCHQLKHICVSEADLPEANKIFSKSIVGNISDRSLLITTGLAITRYSIVDFLQKFYLYYLFFNFSMETS